MKTLIRYILTRYKDRQDQKRIDQIMATLRERAEQ